MKLQDLLQEATGSVDRNYREIARSLFNAITNYLDAIDENEFIRKQMVRQFDPETATPQKYAMRLFTFELRPWIDPENFPFDYFILFLNPTHREAAYTGRHGADEEILIGMDYSIETIGKVRDQTTSDITDNLITEEGFINHRVLVKGMLQFFRRSLIHETIHVLDDGRTQKEKVQDKGERSWEDYINSPEEFNAFFQETMDVFDEHVERIQQTGQLENEFVDLENFENFRQQFYDELMDEFKQYMNLNTQRRLDKRIYQAWVDFREQVGID